MLVEKLSLSKAGKGFSPIGNYIKELL